MSRNQNQHRLSHRDIPRALLITGIVLLLAVPTAHAEWHQFRGEPTQVGLGGPLPAELAPVWTARLPDGVEATAAIADGKAIVAGLSGRVVAFELTTGNELWTVELGEEIKSSPMVRDGVIYLGDEFGTFHALELATGKTLWSVAFEAAISASPNWADSGTSCLVVGAYDNYIYCLSPKDGSVRWKVETEGYVHGTPAVWSHGEQQFVVSSGCDGILRVIDVATGALSSQLEIGSYVAGSPAIRDHRMVVGSFDNEVLAVDLVAKGDNKIAWRFRNEDREFPYYSSPAVTDKLVVIGGRDKQVHALDLATGKELWRHGMRARVDASPVITGDRVVVADESGMLKLLSLADGSVAWEFQAEDAFVASPALSGKHLVIASGDGTVYAFTQPKTRKKS